MDTLGPIRVQERSYAQGDRPMVPEGVEARRQHGQPRGQYALEFLRWQEKGENVTFVG